jgi:hypothetical protein
MVALGMPVVLIGLPAGAVGAQAGELSDQSSSNQLLQQKLDLLDHGQDTPNAPPAADANKGSFPGSVRIPGTNTSIRIHGSVSETLEYSR